MNENEKNDQAKRPEIAKALNEFFSKNPKRVPTPEFAAYLDTLDAMDLHIALYLMAELKVLLPFLFFCR